uniref:Uncharacterized protein n=1 Tax=Arion vulgaris TaxID=1028688 RepID=A0A0B7BQW8_9EUPU
MLFFFQALKHDNTALVTQDTMFFNINYLLCAKMHFSRLEAAFDETTIIN